jgi:hypothetical protein
MAAKSKYFDLMAKRKALIFEGRHKEAEKLLDLAEEMQRRGQVTEEESLAAAYL